MSRRTGKKERERLAREVAENKRKLADLEEVERLTDRIQEIRTIVRDIVKNSEGNNIYMQVKDYVPEFVGLVHRVKSLSRDMPQVRAVIDKATKEDGVTIALMEISRIRTEVKADVIRGDKILKSRVIRQLSIPHPAGGTTCIWVGCEHQATVFTNENHVGYCKRHARTAGVTEPGKA